jgi:putative NADH-flavin reductase
MRITVFGATGRTGRYILAEGLRRDHQLTAFTRWPAALVGPSTLAAVAWTTAATRIQSARQSTVRTR